MRSMTGYGRGEAKGAWGTLTVEIAAVNRKQADLRFLLPRELAGLEPRLRLRLQSQVSRGACTVTLAWNPAPELRAGMVTIDAAAMRSAAERLRGLALELGLSREIRVTELLAIPGVVTEGPQRSCVDAAGDAAESAMDQALAAVRALQESEASALAEDFRRRLAVMRAAVAGIRAAGDVALVKARERLVERIRVLGLELDPGDERLAKELAFAAERSDIAEELTRLDSHLDQFAAALGKPEAVGRMLDFLCQEMSREINTLSAKTADTAVSARALVLKAEMERIREQAQNVE